MKKTFLLVALVVAFASIAKSQSQNLQSQQRYDPNGEKGNCNCCVSGDPNCGPMENASHERKATGRYSEQQYPGFTKTYFFLTVSNDAAKTIKQVTWEVALVDPSNAAVSKYKLASRVRIAPHASLMLRESRGIPTDERFMQATRVTRIKEIKYADGSVRSF